MAASDGSDYLFIWRADEYQYSAHYATRVTRDGVALDRVTLPVRRRVEFLTWTGSSYLAVWGEQAVGGKFVVYGLRLDRNGKSIGSIRTLKEDAYPLDLMANGKNVVLGYQEYSWYRVVSKGPRVLVMTADAEPVADLALGQDDRRWSFNLAWNGTHFAAIWITGNGENGLYDDRHYVVLGARFNSSGVVDTTPRVLLEADALQSQWLGLSWQSDGQDFLMVSPAGGRTQARRVSGDLSTVSAPHLLPDWFDHSWGAMIGSGEPKAKLFWFGHDYLLLARIANASMALRIDREGTPIETKALEPAPGSASYDLTATATNGQDVAIAWSGTSPGFGCADSDLFATVTAASTLDRKLQVLVSVAQRDQQSPLVAAGGTNMLAAWASGSSVYARRLSPAGLPIDATPLLLAECATLFGVTFNARDYFVFLARYSGFDVMRVPRDGALRADAGANVNGILIAAASNATGTVILWSKGERYVSRLSADGALAQTVSLGDLWRSDSWWSSQPRNIAMAASGDEFLIVWDEQGDVQYCTPPSDGGFYGGVYPGTCFYRNLIRATRISSDLVNRDPVGFDISTVSPFEDRPKATWNGRQWLVVWHSAGTPRAIGSPRLPDEIRGRFVSREGKVDENPAGLLIASNATSPTVEWNGSRYVIGWQPFESSVSSVPSRATRIAWLTELGGSLTSVNDVTGENRAVIAATGPASAVAIYTRRVSDAAGDDLSRAFIDVIDVTAKARRRSVR